MSPSRQQLKKMSATCAEAKRHSSTRGTRGARFVVCGLWFVGLCGAQPVAGCQGYQGCQGLRVPGKQTNRRILTYSGGNPIRAGFAMNANREEVQVSGRGNCLLSTAIEDLLLDATEGLSELGEHVHLPPHLRALQVHAAVRGGAMHWWYRCTLATLAAFFFPFRRMGCTRSSTRLGKYH